VDLAGHQEKVFAVCQEEGIHDYISQDKNAALKEIIPETPEEEWKAIVDSDGESGAEGQVG